MKFVIFIYLIYIIKKVISLEILNKNTSISTSDNLIIFNSKDFPIDEDIYFKIEIIDKSNSNSFGDAIRYDFYDNINNINYNTIKNTASLEISDESDLIKFFIIKKDKNILNSLNGDYILIKFNINCSKIIENYFKSANSENNSKKKSKGDLFLEIFLPIFIVGFIILCIFCCCADRLRCWDLWCNKDNKSNSVNEIGNSMKKESPREDNNSIIYVKSKNLDKSNFSNRSKSSNQLKKQIKIFVKK